MENEGWKKFLAFCTAAVLVVTGTLVYRQDHCGMAAALAPVRLPDRQLILDAGHGGEDGGAVSLTGVAESGINLAVTLKADQLLGLYGISPILLRKTDISLHDAEADTLRKKKVSDLHNRAAAIESTENAILISIHQNTFSNSAYHGAQTFYREEGESLALAQLLQDTLSSCLDPSNKRTPAKVPDSVYLMKHITCPAVLLECGFLSNAIEEERLRSGEYQTQLALCIAASFLNSREIQGSNPGESMV